MAAEELINLIDEEIPQGRKTLQQSYVDLEKVASYCETNYLQAQNKPFALDETKNYTTQSLASVAYQINRLASNFLRMLSLQSEMIADMESSVRQLAQQVDIHKEKVARREIGVLTTSKSASRQHKIIAPAQLERAQKYVRTPIDYAALDEMGHGVKISKPEPRVLRQSSVHSTTSTVSSRSGTIEQGTATVGRSSRGADMMAQYSRIAASNVQGDYASIKVATLHRRGSTASSGASSASGYATRTQAMGINHVPTPQVPPTPNSSSGYASRGQIGMGSDDSLVYRRVSSRVSTASDNWVPPPPPSNDVMVSNHYNYTAIDSPMPPPPMYPSAADLFDPRPDSPPLPPPPPEQPERSSYPSVYQTPEWVPKTYLEKVIAIYDYEREREDELSFSENSVIYVIKKNEDGWYEGVIEPGMTGLFPGNYVEPCI